MKITIVFAMLVFGGVASAHHSAAMFDYPKVLTLAGTVREFQFNNPHCYIQLLVTDATGGVTEWSIEMGAPTHLFRAGWKPNTLKVGDKISVTLTPLRNGGNGGEFKSAVRSDTGESIGGQ
jgi:hypothetical protein